MIIGLYHWLICAFFNNRRKQVEYSNSWMGPKVFQIEKLLEQINTFTSEIKFNTVLKSLQRLYSFRCGKVSLSDISQCNFIGKLAIACYRCVMAKILGDLVQHERQWNYCPNILSSCDKSLPLIEKYQSEEGNSIKEAYHGFLSEMKNKKAETMELSLFLIFISCPPVLISVCKNSELMQRYLHIRLSEEDQNICVWACVIVNYYLADIKVSPRVYEHLKKQFIRDENLKISMSSGFKCSDKSSQRKQTEASQFLSFDKMEDSDLARYELTKQLDTIFVRRSDKPPNPVSSVLRKKNRKISRRTESFYKEGSNSPSSKLKNNNLFPIGKENSQASQGKSVKMSPGVSARIRKRERKTIKLQASHQNFHGLLTSALYQIQNKDKGEKLTNPPEITKLSLKDWKERISQLRNSANIERVDLRKSCQRPSHQRGKSALQDDAEKLKYLCDSYFSEHNMLKDIKSLRRNFSKKQQRSAKGFCEYIDVREPGQINIVKDVVNFTCYSPEKKERKFSSRQLLKEFKWFQGQMGDRERLFRSDNNYNLRLQMALSGSTKV